MPATLLQTTRQIAPRPATATPSSTRPPVIVLGGGANALSVARSLGKIGVRVYALNFPKEYVCRSRHATPLPVPCGPDYAREWAEYLLGPWSDWLQGAVLLAASDAGLMLIARHRAELAAKYLLDDSSVPAQQTMLNKLATYRAAVAAGVPTPKFWVAQTPDDIEQLRDELVFPLIVKPELSHLFEERFGAKFLVAKDYEQLLQAFRTVADARIPALLMEQIPGPDSQLCSYYTYLDEECNPLFDFTKRIIRRFPVNMGAACYHITDWIPEIREPALRLFRGVGLRGLANVEFKLDERDGQYKLIECNARFTAANGLVARCGMDLAQFVYRRLTGEPQQPLTHFRSGMRLWYPLEDFKAFRELNRRGELSWTGWIKSLLHPQMLPFFAWSDPWPSVSRELRRCLRMFWKS
ncbi:MAG TPA: ATP-grasp domain-containing protein [Planctomycetaceae bacterium]|nr:ATP-grasp domain-containing protein [Planctomycetaceae bacterium]